MNTLIKGHEMEQIAIATSTPIAYAASGISIYMGLTVGEWQAIGVIGGLILGILTYATNLYYKRKADKRASN